MFTRTKAQELRKEATAAPGGAQTAGNNAAHRVTLQDLLRQVETDPAGRRLVHFHVSALEANAKDVVKVKSAVEYLRQAIATAAFGDVIVVPNRDIICWVRGMRLGQLMAVARKIEDYFCDSKEFGAKNFYGEMYFYTIIDASTELGRFRAFAVSMLDFGGKGCAQGGPGPKELISVDNFSKIVDLVQHSDLTAHIFNQPIYNITLPKPSIEFIEFYTSVKSFEEALCPSYSIAGDPWLFNRLTEEFDRAVLRHMGKEIADYRHKGFSLNLNLRSVMSREFSLFADALSAKMTSRIILEINKVSMFSNWQLFDEVLSLARQRGFRVCIDGMDVRDFANLQLTYIDFDFIKLKWSIAAMAEHRMVERAVRTLTAIDRGKVVLSMCDSDQAFAFAHAAGISLVQGYLADKYFRHEIIM